MDSSRYPCKDDVRRYAVEQCGFDACGFAAAGPVSDEAIEAYRRWIARGRNFSMPYLEKYADIRDNPARLLEGAHTIIVTALNYYPAEHQNPDAPQFAYYAYGRDYHEVVRERLQRLADFIGPGAACRICVDTAPLRERYWAQQAGIGFVGRNNQLILPGKGSWFFLGEIVTTADYSPDNPCTDNCGDCRLCVKACPGHALPGDYGAVDASRCISCFTIEHRGALPANAARCLGRRVYGCDECQHACPYNRNATPTHVVEFTPSAEFLSLSADSLARMTEDDFRRVFRHSAVRRTKLTGLSRNFDAIRRNFDILPPKQGSY